jgi:hypothetical protein
MSMVPEIIVEWKSKGSLDETEAGKAVEDDAERVRRNVEAEMKEIREEVKQALANQDFETAKALDAERKTLEVRRKQMRAERDKFKLDFEGQRHAAELEQERQQMPAEQQRQQHNVQMQSTKLNHHVQ